MIGDRSRISPSAMDDWGQVLETRSVIFGGRAVNLFILAFDIFERE